MLGFSRVSIFRPSLLLLDKDEVRPDARGCEALCRMLVGWLGDPQSVSVHARVVAKVISDKGGLGCDEEVEGEVRHMIYENSDIHREGLSK
jgi:hypothetical protein